MPSKDPKYQGCELIDAFSLFHLALMYNLQSSDMIASLSEYGPFAPVVGYAGALITTVIAIAAIWSGRTENWRPPEEVLPGTGQKFVFLFCAVGMTLQWYLASPTFINYYLAAVSTIGVLSFAAYIKYTSLLKIHVYHKLIGTGPESVRVKRILGGRTLLPEAEEIRKKKKISVQKLLEGAAYERDQLWSREAQDWVQTRVLLLFVFTLFAGTSALTGASFAVQVILTQKAASSVIRSSDAPGLGN